MSRSSKTNVPALQCGRKGGDAVRSPFVPLYLLGPAAVGAGAVASGAVMPAAAQAQLGAGRRDRSVRVADRIQTVWVPVQSNGTGAKGSSFADPNVNSARYISGNATGGANCASSSYTRQAVAIRHSRRRAP